MMVRQLSRPATFVLLLLQSQQLTRVVNAGWGGGSSETDMSMYADSFSREWLDDSTAIAMKLEGCAWGYVYDSEEAGCMEDESEDGTYYWYQMANCRRAQAVFSLYATDSSNSVSCSSKTYKETFVTKVGVPDFVAYLKEYDANSPFSDDDGGDDDGYGGWSLDELPLCEQAEDGYLGLSCGDDGSFTIDYFYDEYCLQSIGTYNYLYKLNNQLKTYKNCQGIYSSNDGDSSLLQYIVPYSESCTSLDSSLCTDDSAMSSRRSSAGSGFGRRKSSSSKNGHASWSTKLKYALGGVLLLASFILFTGILFTNRRRRRALMQRKFKQSSRSHRDDKSRRTSKSNRSKARDKDSRRSRTKRSRSRGRDGNMLT